MDVKGLSKSFGGPWQGLCSWTKQCIHFNKTCKCQKHVEGLSTSFKGPRQSWCSQTKQCIHFETCGDVKRMLDDYHKAL